jgi:hypothetical protein
VAWDELRENKTFDLGFSPEDLMNTEGSYRAAYPAYRVFVYGYEITQDVTEIRINQAGGSAERVPSGISFAVANKGDQYLLTHKDMLNISKAKNKTLGDLDAQITEIRADFGKWYDTLFNEIDEALSNSDITGAVEIIKSLGWLDNYWDIVDPSTGEYSREKLASVIKEAADKRRIKLKGLTSVDWDDSYLLYGSEIKQEIIESKMSYKTETVPIFGPTFEAGDREVFYNYPMQEGMCIFHQNDPVRIVVRDPFDPRMWYWGFTGFIDSTTENSGVNKDSMIMITCTDVSKMARYSTLQSQNFMDPDVVDRYADSTAADIGVTFYNEIFQGLTIYEILETLFFGAKSTLSNVSPRTFLAISSMSDEEIGVFINQHLNALNKEDLDDIFDLGVADSPGVITSQKEGTDTHYRVKNIDKARQKLFRIQESQKKQQLIKFKDIGVITHPRGVTFKRKDAGSGLYVYFKGELDESDKAIGDDIVDLWNWNEIIHHRIRKDDLFDMYAKKEDGSDNSRDPAYSGTVNERDFPYDPSMMSIQDVITAIGTDLDNFPVGAGRVFLLMPATVEAKLKRGILDKTLGGVNTMHSKFRDRLSLLYDLANRIDFRCYATPKGDFVFEMPFYDFNVEHFLNKKQLSDMWDQKLNRDINTKWRADNHEAIFREVYSGNYSADAVQKLTKLRFETEELQGLDTLAFYSDEPYFDYSQQFVIEEHEQIDYSDTTTDQGVYTLCLAQRNTVANQKDINFDFARKMGDARRLVPMLGVRVLEEDVWGFTDTDEQAAYYCNLTLNRVNAEQHNVGINIIPQFGLMVNRPIFWQKKQYHANIVSMQHSIVWNSSCSTTINVNQVRGWDGERDENTGKPIYRHLAGRRPFDLADVLDMGKSTNVNKKGEV